MGSGRYKGDELNDVEAAAMQLEHSRRSHYVSFYDVVKHPKFIAKTKCMVGGTRTPRDVSEGLLKGILHDYGLDTNKSYNPIFAVHRIYDGTVTDGPAWRWEGVMRLDDTWVRYIYENTGIRLRGPKNKQKRSYM